MMDYLTELNRSQMRLDHWESLKGRFLAVSAALLIGCAVVGFALILPSLAASAQLNHNAIQFDGKF